jgi:hypothetical protein
MSGLYVIGKQGRGKTNFLLNLVAQDLHQGIGLCVMDPHGDLTTDVLACVPPHREDDVLLFDLQDPAHLVGFDLFAGVNPADPASLAAGEERVIGAFKKVWGGVSWGPRLEDLLANCVHVLLLNPGTTLAQLPDLLGDATFRARLLRAVGNPVVLGYFANEYDPLTPRAQAAIYAPVMNKVRAFLRHPLLGEVVSRPGETIDFRRVMARRQILLVRLNAKLPEATSLLGTAIVLRLFEAAVERQELPAASRPPFALYADEFQLFATPTFGDFLQQARKYAVATTVAHQVRSQLDGPLQDAVKAAVNVVTFQVMSDDAREMAREYASNAKPRVPRSPLRWAVNHSDPAIRRAGEAILASIPFVHVRYEEDAPALTVGQKIAFFERRLRQAVLDDDGRATAFPSAYWYGTYDLYEGHYASLKEGFATLQARLLAGKRLEAGDLARLPTGVAAAKLEWADGGMRQFLLRVPLAITPDHSQVVKTVFDHEGPLPERWPPEIDPRHLDVALRARRIRERIRGSHAPIPAPPRPAVPAASEPPPSSSEPPFPFRREVEID